MAKRSTGAQKRAARRRAQREVIRTRAADGDPFGVDFGLVSRGQGQPRPRLLWRLDDEPHIRLMQLAHVRELCDVIERETVIQARAEEISWDDLGFFLGVSGERVRQRHAAAVPAGARS